MELLKKWYFCLSQATIDHPVYNWKEMALVAVRSCKKHTQLEPNLIYSGTEDDFTRMMRKEGVNVIFHQSVLFNDIYKRFSDPAIDNSQFNYLPGEDLVGIGSGVFLRLDIPLLCDDKFALYTDVDVIFNHPIPEDEKIFNAIKHFMAAPEFDIKDFDKFNSGVLVMNVEQMRGVYYTMLQYARKYIEYSCHDWDQGMLRSLFGANERSFLSPLFNWKPYWGYNEKAAIVHFHQIKPKAASNRLTPQGTAIEFFPSEIEKRYQDNKLSYEQYLELYHSYL